MVRPTSADQALPGQEQDLDLEEMTWEAVRDAPGLLRTEIVQAHGRRMTVYRRRDPDGS
jgi:hypothetical protein